jgi:hypothetical protein
MRQGPWRPGLRKPAVPCLSHAHGAGPSAGARAARSNPNTVGGASGDYVAQVAPGSLISTAEGSFMSVTPGIVETGIDPYTREPTHNAFTLQLNTNTFTTVCGRGPRLWNSLQNYPERRADDAVQLLQLRRRCKSQCARPSRQWGLLWDNEWRRAWDGLQDHPERHVDDAA